MSAPLTDYKAKPIELRTRVSTDGKPFETEEWVLEEANWDVKSLVFSEVTKAEVTDDVGLVIEQRSNDGNYYAKEVTELFATYTALAVGHRILKLQNKDIRQYDGMKEINDVLKNDMTITIESLLKV